MNSNTAGITVEKTDIDAITMAKIERVAKSCGRTICDYIACVIEKKTESLPG